VLSLPLPFRCALVLAGLALAPLPAAEPPLTLRVGAARADITPETEVRNWVNGQPYGAVLDPLHVQALVLDDGRTQVVLVRWDLVDVSESARDEVRAAVSAALGVPPEHVLVHASHTHSAPLTPVYKPGYRGRERDLWWTIRHMPPQYDYPPYARWMQRLLAATTDAARRAAADTAAVTPWIGRVTVAEYLHNRRPRSPVWGLADPRPIVPLSHRDPAWNPEVLQGGATFGPMDRALSLVSFRSADGRPRATLFHVACHAVSIYPSDPALSADWPGAATRTIAAALGGDVLFLQGAAGDINPWRRGAAAVAEMADGFARKAQAAATASVALAVEPLQIGRVTVELPLTPAAQGRTGTTTVSTEVQIITCGPLALVALPGEPMTEIGDAIRERSPFPQTLVLGYSNGNGVHYVGMPHERARGGYEVGDAGAGTDEAGPRLISVTERLLNDLFARRAQR
jgi:hypothetical protein